MRSITLVVPNGQADAAHPSGGNRYDGELAAALATRGWDVRMLPIDHASLSGGGIVVVDGLVLPQVVPDVHVIPLLHMAPAVDSLETLARSRAVITTSDWTRNRVLEVIPALHGRITVARPGVARPRALVSTSPAGTRIRSIGALLPHKGQHLLVAALGRLRELEWTCELVGATDLDPEFTLQVRRLADGLGIGDRVVMRGARAATTVDELYAGSDLVVVPSLAESYGMVVAEAIACGVPVVAADTGGVRESFPERAGRRPGILVPRADPRALAAALRTWLLDAELRADLTAEAHARSVERHTWEATAHVVEEVAMNAAESDPVVLGRAVLQRD